MIELVPLYKETQEILHTLSAILVRNEKSSHLQPGRELSENLTMLAH